MGKKMNEICHCGEPLHYTDANIKKVIDDIITDKGRYIAVTSCVTMKTYKVDRHYIALHGLKGAELHLQGFEEITGESNDP